MKKPEVNSSGLFNTFRYTEQIYSDNIKGELYNN